jgi:hypothetical protein
MLDIENAIRDADEQCSTCVTKQVLSEIQLGQEPQTI